MTICGKKFLTFLYWVIFVISAYMLFYEVLGIKELTIDRYIDNSYGSALYDKNGVLLNPEDVGRREAKVPWYGYPLMHLSLYSFIAELFLIPVTVIITVFFTIVRWKEIGRRIIAGKDIRRRLCVYVPILAFAIFTVIYWFRDF